MKALILDAANSNTLSIVRYLGSSGVQIDVVGYNHFSISFYSKYVSKKHIVSSKPKENESRFIDEIIEILKKERYDVLIPVGFYSFKSCVDHQKKIQECTGLIVANAESFNKASDKNQTYELAQKIGVPYPKTYRLKKVEDVDALEINFPAVVKASHEMGKNVVEYVFSKQELVNRYKKMCKKNEFDNAHLPIIQEYIQGEGYGFFAYYEQGVCKRIFMHRRIREYPASGGASVCAESFYDEELKVYGKKMLDELQWNGVAMVEFKKDKNDNKFKLMEVNPKFWGSLELALAAGVNFPLFMLQSAKNEQINFSENFEKMRFHWILNGELYHFISRPFSAFLILKDLFNAKSDIWWSDIKPNLFQFINIFIHYFKKITGK